LILALSNALCAEESQASFVRLQITKELDMNAPAKTNEIDPLLDAAEAAKLLGISPSWLAKSRMTGTGPRFIKVGRSVRYARSAVREYLLSRQRNSTSEA
jgi:predicted DNA-binding transcriptional regulator AlpA